MLYSPCFLFKLLSLFNEIMGVEEANTEDSHPDNNTRHAYLARMLKDLQVKINIEELDTKIDNIVRPKGKRIMFKVQRILKKRKKLIGEYREMLAVAW